MSGTAAIAGPSSTDPPPAPTLAPRLLAVAIGFAIALSLLGGILGWSPWVTFAATVLPLAPSRLLYRRWRDRWVGYVVVAPADDEHHPVDLGAWATAGLAMAALLVGGKPWVPLGVWCGVAIATAGADALLRRRFPRLTAGVDRAANAVYDRF